MSDVLNYLLGGTQNSCDIVSLERHGNQPWRLVIKNMKPEIQAFFGKETTSQTVIFGWVFICSFSGMYAENHVDTL